MRVDPLATAGHTPAHSGLQPRRKTAHAWSPAQNGPGSPCLTHVIPHSSSHGTHGVGRRRFLAGVGATVAGITAIALTGASASAAETMSRSPGARARLKSDHPLYRRGIFRRGRTWTTPDARLLVTARRPIRSTTGGMRFDRNGFEVVFRQTKGSPLGRGAVTITNEDGTSMPLYLAQTGPRTYSAIINRTEATA